MEGVGMGLQVGGVVVSVSQVPGEHSILTVVATELLPSTAPLLETTLEGIMASLPGRGEVDGQAAVRGACCWVVAVVVCHLERRTRLQLAEKSLTILVDDYLSIGEGVM